MSPRLAVLSRTTAWPPLGVPGRGARPAAEGGREITGGSRSRARGAAPPSQTKAPRSVQKSTTARKISAPMFHLGQESTSTGNSCRNPVHGGEVMIELMEVGGRKKGVMRWDSLQPTTSSLPVECRFGILYQCLRRSRPRCTLIPGDHTHAATGCQPLGVVLRWTHPA